MKLLIISHVFHKLDNHYITAYSPYVREMNLWSKYANHVIIVAPKTIYKASNIDLAYKHKKLDLIEIPSIAFISIKDALVSVIKTPKILLSIFKACKKVDHIHLRCPGNIGLLGSIVQICFPKKMKTAKYAGNWDPRAKQPLSYKFQKWILSNTFLTKNMQVLVYGTWSNQTKNIKPFFTSSISKKELPFTYKRQYTKTLQFLFVGSLSKGKRPLLALQIMHKLIKNNVKLYFHIYGDGVMKEELNNFIKKNNLKQYVILHGNQDHERIKNKLKKAHFLILPSKSEGWPKVVAEAMFFGCIPIVTAISCVPFMVGNGKRGIIIKPDIALASETIMTHLKKGKLDDMALNASKWSQQYTIEKFEEEIKTLLNG